MPRVKHAVSSRKHRKKALKAAKGQYGSRHRLYRIAKEAGIKAAICSYIDRKRKKREFRSLWITRLNAACVESGISYSKFVSALKKAGIVLNRRVLADMAVNDKKAFKAVVDAVKK